MTILERAREMADQMDTRQNEWEEQRARARQHALTTLDSLRTTSGYSRVPTVPLPGPRSSTSPQRVALARPITNTYACHKGRTIPESI
jgi:hypothetical protein